MLQIYISKIFRRYNFYLVYSSWWVSNLRSFTQTVLNAVIRTATPSGHSKFKYLSNSFFLCCELYKLLASSAHSHNTRFSKKKNFITERPRTRLGLNCFKYLGPKFWSSVPETFKNLKKDCFKVKYKNFLLNSYKE